MEAVYLRLLVTRKADALGGNRVFRKQGSVRDFCENCVVANQDAIALASSIIEYFCIDDGAFNEFLPGVELAIAVLCELKCSPEIPQLKRALLDLKFLLANPWNAETFRQWANSHFV